MTVHLIDAGIDTGKVIRQSLIEPTPEDNFTSYPLLQLAAAIPLLIEALKEFAAGNLKFEGPLSKESRLWSHPTIDEYLAARWRHRVK